MATSVNDVTVIGGVDTHKHTHHASVLDEHGRLLDHREFAANEHGYADLLDWMRGIGNIEAIGVESTGSFGATLTRLLTSRGVTVVEVNRPNRLARRLDGKSDRLDAENIGTELAGQFLVTAGDNPERIHNEAAFAKLCGVAPQPASSGRTSGRHRLSRSGDRAANSALYIITIVRMRHDPRTRAYVERRTKREIIRCLKRYIAREIYKNLPATGHKQTTKTHLPEAA